MPGIKRFEDIRAWQKARELVRDIYGICAKGALKADFGLKNRLCRATVSSMSNIAEGFARRTDKDFAHFLDMAKGSVVEVQSLLYVALDVLYIDTGDFERLTRLADETAVLIGGLTSYLRKHSAIPEVQ